MSQDALAFARSWRRASFRVNSGGPVLWHERALRDHGPVDWWQLHLVVDTDTGILHARGRLSVPAGRPYLIPPGTTWRQHRPRRSARHVQLLFGLDQRVPGRPPLAGVDRPLVLQRPAVEPLHRYLTALEGGGWSDDPDHLARFQPVCEGFVYAVLHASVAAGDLAPPPGGREVGLVGELQELIVREARHPDFGLPDLLRAAGLSRSRLTAVFRAATGQPPATYLRRWRLHFAARLLADGGVESVAEVARRSGFSSQALLARHFRREFGVPPSRWRAERHRSGTVTHGGAGTGQ